MNPSEIRWRCKRLAALLQIKSRSDALVIAATEARRQPWLNDPRPPPPPLPLGGYIGA